MFTVTAPITTDRLLLRPFTPDDVDDVWAYQRQPEVARHLLWEARDRAQTEAAVEQMVRETTLAEDGDCLSLAAVLPETDQIVGQVELVWRSRENRQGEVGYVFNPDFHGKGLATEAARALLRLGFEGLDLHRIFGRCSAHNLASAKLMERLGMRREAHFVDSMRIRGSWREELVYAMLQREWAATAG
ncbi:Protein N-acetyltransferase, RimJ/RimL family [Saccharopolyspora antimicrobica]|uniref:Protein N-acetyltransferase, RimJ/RimL family n=1 Tax=Saccharopolyspora antimicrobica TaxID=455193 RepID=A0A1I4RT12_9PSEU|nr:GNAT family N-acetyltransferase [Saccharopolyspora antimicrobica]RKT87889.1 RimJ/RimL family protein N-acetyltransferase [Saccharopolyspora antimicrobica]SFM55366.1 Protein N-acetyltransferase, RimJ/RimL family [Saccharopolyspora antimicrobica]